MFITAVSYYGIVIKCLLLQLVIKEVIKCLLLQLIIKE